MKICDGVRIFVDYSTINFSSREMFLNKTSVATSFWVDDKTFICYQLNESWLIAIEPELKKRLKKHGPFEITRSDCLYEVVLLLYKAKTL